MPPSLVCVRTAAEQSILDVTREVMDALRWRETVPQGARVVIKPNLCTPHAEQAEAANVSTELIEAVCRVLLERTDDITLVEADGMRYRAEEAFAVGGVDVLANQLGIRVANLSKAELVESPIRLLKGWPLPRVLLEADAFITLPVLKTHTRTYFTGCLKNQWGCVPQYHRILLHKHLDRLLAELHHLLRPALCIMDGLVGMEGRGPVSGRLVHLGVVLGSRDGVALDAAAMRLVGLDPERARHVALAARLGYGRFRPEEIEVDSDVEITHRFEPGFDDWAGHLEEILSRSRFLTKSIILNDRVYFPIRRMVLAIRSLGRS